MALGGGMDGLVRQRGYAYNNQGLPEKFTSYDASDAVVNQVQRAYNGLGQLMAEYQAHTGAVNTSTTPRVQYGYGNLAHGGRIASMTYPSGRVLNYTYGAANGLADRIGRLAALVDEDDSTVLEGYDYLGLGMAIKRSHPQSGVDLTYLGSGTGDGGDQYTGLDRFGRIVQQTWTDGTGSVDAYGYTYDRNGGRTARNNVLSNSLNESYSYDSLDRLTTFGRVSGREQAWELDALGNWDTITTDSITESRTHNGQNQLTQIGSTNLGYDGNGNTTTDQNGHTLIYDAWNRLVEVKNGPTTLVRYEFDALNRRIKEGTVHLYYTAQWQVLEERNASGTTTMQYVWSPVYVDAMVLRDRDTNSDGTLDERLYVTQDANFNVTALVGTDGLVKQRYVYDPYGLASVVDAGWAAATDSYAWRYLHQGGRLDGSTGLYHFRNREYSPVLGRWMQQDPLGQAAGQSVATMPASEGDLSRGHMPTSASMLTSVIRRVAEVTEDQFGTGHAGNIWLWQYADSMNLQEYVHNNPLNEIDPSGFQANVPVGLPLKQVKVGLKIVDAASQMFAAEAACRQCRAEERNDRDTWLAGPEIPAYVWHGWWYAQQVKWIPGCKRSGGKLYALVFYKTADGDCGFGYTECW